MSLDEKVKKFRNLDTKVYPELKHYTSKQTYEDFIGCGGLYLATKMVRQMNIKKGDIVLDLGCGMGSTSIYLAKNFDITVIAVDLWNNPKILEERVKKESCSNSIIPLQLDITQSIPFNMNYFDAIFCMNSLFMFGDNHEFLKRLLSTLKVGGIFCIGSECFNKEPNYLSSSEIPSVYNFDWNWSVWESCYSKYHSPRWWSRLLESTDSLDITYCEELNDGRIMFEDFALNYHSYISDSIKAMGVVIPQERIVEQVVYGFESGLYPTLFILIGVKN